MKAYVCSSNSSDEGLVTIVYADTASKAKMACDWDEIQADFYTDVRVKRVPQLDDMENDSYTDMCVKALKEEIFSGVPIGGKIYYPEDIATQSGEEEFRKAMAIEYEH